MFREIQPLHIYDFCTALKTTNLHSYFGGLYDQNEPSIKTFNFAGEQFGNILTISPSDTWVIICSCVCRLYPILQA